MYLVDTNVWLELLLGQARSEEVGRFLANTPSEQLFITDFALHSIGIVLVRLRRPESLVRFVRDTLIDGAVQLARLAPEDTESVLSACTRFALDFDDA